MKLVVCLSALVGVLVLASCDHSASFTPLRPAIDEEALITKILYEGDTVAYIQFYQHYLDEGSVDRCLPYALVMANKYHYPLACYHVYEILKGLYAKPLPVSDDPELVEWKSAVSDIDSALAVARAADPSIDMALGSMDRGLDYLDPETRSLALSYYGRSLQ